MANCSQLTSLPFKGLMISDLYVHYIRAWVIRLNVLSDQGRRKGVLTPSAVIRSSLVSHF